MLRGFADQEHERLRPVHSFAQFSLYVVFAPRPIGHVVQVVSVEKLEINPLVRAPPSHKAVGPNILVAIKCYVRRHSDSSLTAAASAARTPGACTVPRYTRHERSFAAVGGRLAAGRRHLPSSIGLYTGSL